MSTILSKLITKKATRLEGALVYSFEVAVSASKHQIAESLFQLYGKRPVAVRTSTRPGKQYRAGKSRAMHAAADKKVAYVTFKEALGNIIQSAK